MSWVRSRRFVQWLCAGVLSLLLATGAIPAAEARAQGGRSFERPVKEPALTKGEQRRWTIGRQLQDASVSGALIAHQIEKIAREAKDDGVSVSTVSYAGGALWKLHFSAPRFMAGAKTGDRRRRPLKVLVSAGVHGNEPSGVLTALHLIKKLALNPSLRRGFDITVLPSVNPTGLAQATRENAQGTDLNRSFPGMSPETTAVGRALGTDKFDLFVDLHGSHQDGFFLIRAGDDHGLSGRILAAMHGGALMFAPKNNAYEMHGLGIATSSNPGTFKTFMAERGTKYSYTFEYPRRLDPKRQTTGLYKMLLSTLHNVRRHGRFEHAQSP